MPKKQAKGIVVFFFGLPGSGKSTQAEMLAESESFPGAHIETSQVIVRALDSGKEFDELQDGTLIDLKEEKRKFDSGELNTTKWVLELMYRALAEVAEKELSVVLSGSPRTVFEAERLMPVLDELFKLRYSLGIYLELPEEVAKERLLARGRTLDADFALRFRRFREETEATIAFIANDSWNIKICRVNGEHSRETIHGYILHALLGGC